MSLLRARAEKLVSNTSSTAVVAIVGLTAFAWVFLSSSGDDNSKLKGLKVVPSPKGSIPYFGHLLSLEEEAPVAQFRRWHEELGPLISIRMGVKQWMLIADPHLAYQIFNVNGRHTSVRPFTTYLSEYYAINCKGLTLGNPSEMWKKTRAAVVQLISPKNRESLEKLHFPEADALIKSLLDTTEKQGAVEVYVPLQLASLNVILSTCFGKRAESTDDPLFKTINSVMMETMRRGSATEEMNTFLPILTVFDILLRKREGMRKFIDEKRTPLIEGLIKEVIDNRVDCFTKTLLEMEDVNDHDNLVVAIGDLIFAGTDTAAVTLSWMMIILCSRPEVQKKIRDEVDQFIAIHKRLPTFDERDSLPYSNSVQKECMRFRPTTPFGIAHEATEDFECNGYIIPKGTTLVSNMHAMHHNKYFYSNPDEFIPDRFYNHDKPMYTSANGKIEERDHFNFGWGRRSCPGAYLAELEMFNVWVRLFSKCVVEPAIDANGKPVYPDPDTLVNGGIVTLPSNPTMRIVKRTDALI